PAPAPDRSLLARSRQRKPRRPSVRDDWRASASDPMADDQEPLLDANDIQGNILPGFNRKQQYLVAFSSDNKDALQAALAALPRPTPLITALEHRDDRKAALVSGMRRPVRGDLWLNVAL